jgi:hypothetical protein
MPPLSPMSEAELASLASHNKKKPPTNTPNAPRITMQISDPVISNLAAIQMLRLRLRLQASCVGEKPTYITIQPTLLQVYSFFFFCPLGIFLN